MEMGEILSTIAGDSVSLLVEDKLYFFSRAL